MVNGEWLIVLFGRKGLVRLPIRANALIEQAGYGQGHNLIWGVRPKFLVT